MAYPTSFDSLETDITNARLQRDTHPALTNATSAAVNQIESTLGTDPQGGYSTVGERIAAVTTRPLTHKGTWNATTNSPSLADGTGTNGDAYAVSVAGTRNLGSGSQTFAVGDWVAYNGTIWQRIPASGLSLSPASSGTNVIQPTGAAVKGLTLKQHTGQSADLLQIVDPDGNIGIRAGSGRAVGGLQLVQPVDLLLTTAEPQDSIDAYNRSTGDCFFGVHWGGEPAAGYPDGIDAGDQTVFNALIPYWNYPAVATDTGTGLNDRKGTVGLKIQTLAPNDDVKSMWVVHQGNAYAFQLDIQNPTHAGIGTGGGININDWSDQNSIVITKHTAPVDGDHAELVIETATSDHDAILIKTSGGANKIRLLTNGDGVFYGDLTVGFNTSANKITIGNSPNSRPEIFMTLASAITSLYIDTSGGKHRLMCLFPTGAAQQVAIEP